MIEKLKEKALNLRKKIIKVSYISGAGHITSSLSSVEILNTLYAGGILRYDSNDPNWDDRDRFIMSKGHATLALYNVLCDAGFVDQKEVNTFCQRGSTFGGLTTTAVPGVECYTGSLGHGLPFAVGSALCARVQKKDYITYVLTGDGECQEGSIWEAALSIAQFNLTNLIWIIDRNDMQLSGKLPDVIELPELEKKLDAFGFDVKVVDGHEHKGLLNALTVDRSYLPNKPVAVIANTVKGKGVPFLENKEGWHGRKPNKEELEIILSELAMSKQELEEI